MKHQRVVISVDGGHTRIRRDKQGKRRQNTNRHGYVAECLEPKLLVKTEDKTTSEETKNDVVMFTITREQYQRYTQWQRELNERIAKQQLSSKKLFDGTQLSEATLHAIRQSFERGEPQPYIWQAD